MKYFYYLDISIPRIMVSLALSYHLAGLHTVYWKQIKYPLHYRLKRNFYFMKENENLFDKTIVMKPVPVPLGRQDSGMIVWRL